MSPHASRPNSSSSVRRENAIVDSPNASPYLGARSQSGEAIEHTDSGNGGVFGGRKAGETDLRHGLLGDAVADGLLGAGAMRGDDGEGGNEEARSKWKGAVQSMSTTQWLAHRHGIKRNRTM